jgi:2-dehydro-3-deoxyphosphogluconate aldolase/(4S)-4-hydroxy-2-oxoglutarate aldolase
VNVVARIKEVGLVPVVRATSAEEATAAAEAIRAGGVPILEITLTVPGAVEIIAALTRRLGDAAIVGAGTVLDAASARECMDAGAAFVVSPGLDVPTIEACRLRGVPVFPGALTPTEVITAWKAGATAVKIFPANAVGGAAYIRALKAPLPQVDMLPTGGVSLTTAADFIHAGAMALGVGGDLVDLAAIRRGDVAAITEKARLYVAAVAQARQPSPR